MKTATEVSHYLRREKELINLEIHRAALNFCAARMEALDAKKERNSHKCEYADNETAPCRYDHRSDDTCEECDAWTSQDLIFREKSTAASRLWTKYKAVLKKHNLKIVSE